MYLSTYLKKTQKFDLPFFTPIGLKVALNRAFQSVVFNSGQKMALRAVYVVIC